MNYLKALETKKPKNKANHIGIEIEFLSIHNQDKIAKWIIVEGLDNVNIAIEDSVIDNESIVSNGYELRICCKQTEVLETMKKVSKILKKAEAYVNDTCGLHVHLDMRNRNYISCLKKLLKAQDFLFQIVDSSRRNNMYCKYVNCFNSTSHYNAINGLEAYSKHQTIEVRMHHGIINYSDIVRWVKLLTELIDSDKIFNPKDRLWKIKIFSLTTKIWINKKLRLYGSTDIKSS